MVRAGKKLYAATHATRGIPPGRHKMNAKKQMRFV